MSDIKKLLEIVLEKDASDLHLAANAAPIIRIHGELKFLNEEGILDPKECESLIFSLIC